MTSPVTDRSFPKRDRVLRRSEFRAIQSKGARVRTEHFTLILRDRVDRDGPRIGITASRKVASSVGRHRVRRLVREVFRHHKSAFPSGSDCVVIVHENIPDLSLVQVRDEVLGALARRGRRQAPPGARPVSGAQKPRSAP
jgi:ribonuclease P protein component